MNKHDIKNIKEAWYKYYKRFKIGHYDRFVIGFFAGLLMAVSVALSLV